MQRRAEILVACATRTPLRDTGSLYDVLSSAVPQLRSILVPLWSKHRLCTLVGATSAGRIQASESCSEGLAFFHDPKFESFFPSSVRHNSDGTPASELAFRDRVLEEHSQRVVLDTTDYLKYKQGNVDSLLEIQKRLEADMAETAYSEYIRDLENSVSSNRTEMTMAQSHLLEWWSPVRNAISLLQVRCRLNRSRIIGLHMQLWPIGTLLNE